MEDLINDLSYIKSNDSTIRLRLQGQAKLYYPDTHSPSKITRNNVEGKPIMTHHFMYEIISK
jgi:hypothetical protein